MLFSDIYSRKLSNYIFWIKNRISRKVMVENWLLEQCFSKMSLLFVPLLCNCCYVVVPVKENLHTALTCWTWHENVHFVKAKLRSSSWWIRYFVQNRLEENEAASKKFEQASTKRLYKPACQVFHLKSHHWKPNLGIISLLCSWWKILFLQAS